LQQEEEPGPDDDQQVRLPGGEHPDDPGGVVGRGDGGDQAGGEPETGAGGEPEVGGASRVQAAVAHGGEEGDDDQGGDAADHPEQRWRRVRVAAGGPQRVEHQGEPDGHAHDGAPFPDVQGPAEHRRGQQQREHQRHDQDRLHERDRAGGQGGGLEQEAHHDRGDAPEPNRSVGQIPDQPQARGLAVGLVAAGLALQHRPGGVGRRSEDHQPYAQHGVGSCTPWGSGRCTPAGGGRRRGEVGRVIEVVLARVVLARVGRWGRCPTGW